MNMRASELYGKRFAQAITIDLSAAGQQVLSTPGDFVYVDSVASKGVCQVGFSMLNASEPLPLNMTPGSSVEHLPYNSLLLSWAAQPGYKMTLLVGAGVSIRNVAGAAPSTPLNSQDLVAPACQSLCQATASVLGFAAVQLLAPAANVKGAVVRSVVVNTSAGAGGTAQAMITAGQIAPTAANFTANVPNTALFAFANSSSTSLVSVEESTLARQVPPGWGLWLSHFTTVTASNASAYVSAEVL